MQSWKAPEVQHPAHTYTGGMPPTEAMFTEDSSPTGFYTRKDDPDSGEDCHQAPTDDVQSHSVPGDGWVEPWVGTTSHQIQSSSSPIPLFRQTPPTGMNKEEELHVPVKQEMHHSPSPAFPESAIVTSSALSSFSTSSGYGKKPTAIPGLDLADPVSSSKPVAPEPAATEENQSKEVLASLGKIVSQLQTLKGLSTSLKLLESLPGVKEKQQEVEKEEETKRTVAALLKDESDSEGEQSKEPPVTEDKPPPSNLNPLDSSPPARDFDGYHVHPGVYNIYESGASYAKQENEDNPPPEYNLPPSHPPDSRGEYGYSRNTPDWGRDVASDHLKQVSYIPFPLPASPSLLPSLSPSLPPSLSHFSCYLCSSSSSSSSGTAAARIMGQLLWCEGGGRL